MTYKLPDGWTDHQLRVLLEEKGFECVDDHLEPGYQN